MSEVCKIDTENLVIGDFLFAYDKNLKTWRSPLSKLESGNGMFYVCSNLEQFVSYDSGGNMSRLSCGYNMFSNCSKLKTFYENLSNLSDGRSMFEFCSDLRLFSPGSGESDLPLINAQRMFYYCDSLSLGGVYGDSQSQYEVLWTRNLQNGTEMFGGARLFDSFYHILSSGDVRPARIEFYFGSQLESIEQFMNGFIEGIASNPNKQQDGKITLTFPDGNQYSNCSAIARGAFGGAKISNVVLNYVDNLADCRHMFSYSQIDKIALNFNNHRRGLKPDLYLMFANTITSELKIGNSADSGTSYSYYTSQGDSLKLGDENFFSNLHALYYPEEQSDVGGFYSYYTSEGIDYRAMFYCFVAGNYNNIAGNWNNFPNGWSGYDTFSVNESGTARLTNNPCLFYGMTDVSLMFSGCPSLTSVHFTNNAFKGDIGKSFCGNEMFSGCINLETAHFADFAFMYCRTAGSMFEGCTKLKNVNLFGESFKFCNSFNNMFYRCTALTSVSFDNRGENSFGTVPTGGVDCGRMFYRCTSLTSVLGDCNLNCTNGEEMFGFCNNLTSVHVNFPNLTNGNSMFNGCSRLSDFDKDLGYLTNGKQMFYCCTALSNFDTPLSRLTDGTEMFCGCTNLTTFTSDLSSLTNGTGMFYDCNLNESSIQNIANTIKDVSTLSITPVIYLGTGHNLSNFTENEKISLSTIINKGWIVTIKEKSNLTNDDLGILPSTPYDIVDGSDYIPDASSWSTDNATIGARVTSVHDGFAWNDNA